MLHLQLKHKYEDIDHMAAFIEVLSDLQNGQSVRRTRWDGDTKMYLEDKALMQQASGKPYPYQLSGEELTATDWAII